MISATWIASAATPQELVRDHPGVWRTTEPGLDARLTGADSTVIVQWTSQIIDVLKHARSLAALKGYDAFPVWTAGPGRLADGGGRPIVTGTLLVYLGPYERRGTVASANRMDAAATIEIRVNDLAPVTGGTAMDGDTVFGDDTGDFVKGPRDPDGDAHGLPAYEEGNDTWLVVRRGEAPVLAPISRERYLSQRSAFTTTRLARANETLTKYGGDTMLAGPIDELKKDIAAMKTYAAALQHQLAAMSPADRAAPAHIASESATEPPTFTKNSDAATVILSVNPRLFDASKPRAAAQVLAIRIDAYNDAWPDLKGTLDREIDWAAFASIIR